MKKVLTTIFLFILIIFAQTGQAQTDEPRFSGCDDPTDLDCADLKMMQFVFSNLKHPEGNPGGQVLVYFTVKADGSLTDLAIEKGLTKECDNEVLRILELMPNWIPAQVEGANVDTEWELEVKFTAT